MPDVSERLAAESANMTAAMVSQKSIDKSSFRHFMPWTLTNCRKILFEPMSEIETLSLFWVQSRSMFPRSITDAVPTLWLMAKFFLAILALGEAYFNHALKNSTYVTLTSCSWQGLSRLLQAYKYSEVAVEAVRKHNESFLSVES